MSQSRPSSPEDHHVEHIDVHLNDDVATPDAPAARLAPAHQSLPGKDDDIMLATGKPREHATTPPTQEEIRNRPGNRAWVPRQHGAWGMLLLPPLVGMLIGGISWGTIFALPAWWGSYLAYWSWTQWLRTRSESRRALLRIPLTAYTLATATLALVAILVAPYLLLWAPVFLPLAAIAAHQVWRGHERSILSGVATTAMASLMTAVFYDLGTQGAGGFLGLGETAATLATSANPSNLTGWHWAWMATACVSGYFVGTVPYVKSMLRGRKSTPLLVGSIALHVVLTCLVAAGVLMGMLPWRHLVIWVALTARAAWLPLEQRRRIDAREPGIRPGPVGYGEVLASLAVVISLLVG